MSDDNVYAASIVAPKRPWYRRPKQVIPIVAFGVMTGVIGALAGSRSGGGNGSGTSTFSASNPPGPSLGAEAMECEAWRAPRSEQLIASVGSFSRRGCEEGDRST